MRVKIPKNSRLLASGGRHGISPEEEELTRFLEAYPSVKLNLDNGEDELDDDGTSWNSEANFAYIDAIGIDFVGVRVSFSGGFEGDDAWENYVCVTNSDSVASCHDQFPKVVAELKERVSHMVGEFFHSGRRNELAAEAKKLVAGTHLSSEDGEMMCEVFRLMAEAEESIQQFVSCEYKGFGHYYLCEGGLWGSKFGPEALEILGFLPQANGTGLVRLAAWVAGGLHRTVECEGHDYFFQTQVKGEECPLALSAEALAAASIGIKLVDVAAIRERQKKHS